jgi:NDP-sugar pyrophosphorylase family protein
MHIVDPEIFKYMDAGVYTMTNLYLKLASENSIYTFLDDSGYWGEIGTPESLESVRKLMGKSH